MHDMFADWYSKADRDPTPARLQSRSDGIEAFNKKTSVKDLLNLLRFLAGKEFERDGLESLKISLKEKDSSFFLRDNDLELQVVATISLILAIEENTDNTPATALAIQTASKLGTEELGPLPKDLIGSAQRYLIEQGSEKRNEPDFITTDRLTPPVVKITELKLQPATAAWEPLVANVNSITEFLKGVRTSLLDISKQVSKLNEIQKALEASVHFNRILGEEADILWWLIGEHSRDTDLPWKALPPHCLGLFIGKDLADLTRLIPGPQAIPAIMHKAFDMVGVKSDDKVELAEVVDAAPLEWRSKWVEDADLHKLRGIGYCLPAIAASVELKGNDSWRDVLERRDSISPSIQLTQIDWASLCYCECLLLHELNGEDDDK